MAIIHCGFVLQQNKSINHRLISLWNHSRDRIHNIITKNYYN